MVRRSRSNLSVSANRKLVKVKFLDGTSTNIETQVDSTLQDVFIKACHSISILDTSLFGLAIRLENNWTEFLDLECKITKFSPKSWKSLNQGVDGNGEPVMTLFLLVQFYADKISSIRDSKARSYYYRQLKSNYIDYPIMYPDDRCFLLAAYAMIAEEVNSENSFDPREFFPAWVIDKHTSKYIREHLPSLTRDFPNLSKREAESLVMTALCYETPVTYNMHLYPMSKESATKQNSTPSKHCSSKYCNRHETEECLQCNALYFGVGPKGVEMFEVGPGGFIHSLNQLSWNHIEYIHYTKKKLEVVGEGMSTPMYCADELLSKNVLSMCQKCHSIHMAREREKFSRNLNKSFRNKYRVSYVSSLENADSGWKEGTSEYAGSMSSSFTHTPGDLIKKDRTKRYSIISDAGSSTTSGIVSDRTCFSYYDSQEEFLNQSKTITSSQDSLLEPSECVKSRPVQRATSEPSKKFQHLRALNVKQQPPLMSRAVSDDTVPNSHVNDHIYENISEVRNCLLIAAQSKPNKLSPRVTLDMPVSVLKCQPDQNTQNLQSQGVLSQSVQSIGHLNQSAGHMFQSSNQPNLLNQSAAQHYQSAGQLHHMTGHLHQSTSQLNQLNRIHNQTTFYSQYNIAKRSVSVEQLLNDYQPPPSYNERHKKVREQMLASMSQETIIQREDNSTTQMHRKSSSNETPQVTQKSNLVNGIECTCRTTSYPEIDKLKNMADLPMISALFNDKNLLSPTQDCQHCTNNNNEPIRSPSTNRPLSWHSESFFAPQSLPAVSMFSSPHDY